MLWQKTGCTKRLLSLLLTVTILLVMVPVQVFAKPHERVAPYSVAFETTYSPDRNEHIRCLKRSIICIESVSGATSHKMVWQLYAKVLASVCSLPLNANPLRSAVNRAEKDAVLRDIRAQYEEMVYDEPHINALMNGIGDFDDYEI